MPSGVVRRIWRVSLLPSREIVVTVASEYLPSLDTKIDSTERGSRRLAVIMPDPYERSTAYRLPSMAPSKQNCLCSSFM